MPCGPRWPRGRSSRRPRPWAPWTCTSSRAGTKTWSRCEAAGDPTTGSSARAAATAACVKTLVFCGKCVRLYGMVNFYLFTEACGVNSGAWTAPDRSLRHSPRVLCKRTRAFLAIALVCLNERWEDFSVAGSAASATAWASVRIYTRQRWVGPRARHGQVQPEPPPQPGGHSLGRSLPARGPGRGPPTTRERRSRRRVGA